MAKVESLGLTCHHTYLLNTMRVLKQSGSPFFEATDASQFTWSVHCRYGSSGGAAGDGIIKGSPTLGMGLAGATDQTQTDRPVSRGTRDSYNGAGGMGVFGNGVFGAEVRSKRPVSAGRRAPQR